MKLIRIAALAAIALSLTAPAFAQSRLVEVTGWYSQIDPQGDPDPNFSNLDDIEFDGDDGFGAAVNLYFGGRLSLEVAAYSTETGIIVTPATGPAIATGNLKMIPVTGTLQFHLFPGGRFDVYGGAGLAYILFDEANSFEDIGNVDIERIDFEDDYGYVFNAGASFGITEHVALAVEAKYVPIESSARAVFVSGSGQDLDIELNPMILSAGLSFRF